jgi:nucleoid DNA-binding protein
MAKKAVKKKATASRAKAAPKAAAKPAKISAASKARSQGEVFRTIAEQVGIQRSHVASVFQTMAAMIKADLSKAGAGVFKVPGLMRITVKRKPATPAREGINPFTKEPTTFKAKPARNVVRIRPLSALRDMV